MNGQLTKKILISGTITAKTGLHIGGNNVGLSIGGADATVVRNPLTNEPYIPGSSLKGKMRSLLEKVEGKFGSKGIGDQIKNPPFTDDPDHIICKIFGTMPEIMKATNKEQPTSRLIVRDCNLVNKDELEKSKDTDMPFTEVKTEVVIDRITSAATPRQLERVPAGAVFNMRMILNVYDGDNEKELLDKVFEGLALVQNDYLGGKGTRGSGEVDIKISQVQFKKKEQYESGSDWQTYEKYEVKENDNYKEDGDLEIPTELK
jgi:CRISPR-associated protein Csm3